MHRRRLRSLYGAVDYAYQIAKNETTIAQYAEFLNAVAATDTYELYSNGRLDDGYHHRGYHADRGVGSYSVCGGSGQR